VFVVNLSVTGALIEAPRALDEPDDMVSLQFTLLAQPSKHQVIVTTRATVKNVNVVKASREQDAVYTYGLQFVDLDIAHYSLLQNLTNEAMIADCQKIV
jgi:hypothetical protein